VTYVAWARSRPGTGDCRNSGRGSLLKQVTGRNVEGPVPENRLSMGGTMRTTRTHRLLRWLDDYTLRTFSDHDFYRGGSVRG